jgi:hypothetical protein
MGDSSTIDLSIAGRPNNPEALPALLQDLTLGVNALTLGGPVDREDLLTKCRFLLRALETPRETMVNHLWAQVEYLSVTRLCFVLTCSRLARYQPSLSAWIADSGNS